MEASNYVSAVLWMVTMKSRAFWDIRSSPLKSQIVFFLACDCSHQVVVSTHPSHFLTKLRLLSYDFHPVLGQLYCKGVLSYKIEHLYLQCFLSVSNCGLFLFCFSYFHFVLCKNLPRFFSSSFHTVVLMITISQYGRQTQPFDVAGTFMLLSLAAILTNNN